MFAFTRLFSLALFLVALIMADHLVTAIPIKKSPLTSDSPSYSGAAGPANGGDSIPSSPQPCPGGCAGTVRPLLNVFSGNAGDAGQSITGKSGSCKGKRDNGRYSGAAGTTNGGNGAASNGIVNVLSGNGGDGGISESGDAC